LIYLEEGLKDFLGMYLLPKKLNPILVLPFDKLSFYSGAMWKKEELEEEGQNL
jgi:hypothetical protein